MAIFRLAGDKLLPFIPKTATTGLYEKEIEDLVWSFPEEFLGEPLFLVARQPVIEGGGRPDIIALDSDRRVVVIEVKRDLDRGQLAQALEYAGWAVKTNLDEIAIHYSNYHKSDFLEAWTEFGEAGTPTVTSPPRMVLVAQRLHSRTSAAVDFLLATGVGIEVRLATLHSDDKGDLILEVDGVDPPHPTSSSLSSVVTRRHFGVRLEDLAEAGLLSAGEPLRWHRPRKGETHHAVLLPGGAGLKVGDMEYPTPSSAADALGKGSFDGWECWEVQREGERVRLHRLREEYLDQEANTSGGNG